MYPQRFKLSELPHLKEIAEELDCRLVVIDTLSRAKDASVSESSAEMSQVLEPLQEMADELDCCILLVHHTGKVSVDNASQIDLFDTIRGSSAIRAVCRGSMVIAAGDRDYRLVCENGWGKHDLRVVLDANTLTWKLLGRWTPKVENNSQRDQILDFLKQTQCATLEQIHEGTGIPKKSLYEQLSRLQVTETASEKVVKEGSRRKYTYRLALFNNIQQLNSVLNSANADTASDTGYIQQKNHFQHTTAKVISDQIGTCDSLITSFSSDQASDHFVEQASNSANADTAGNTAIDSTTGTCANLITLSDDDHSVENVLNSANADTASDTTGTCANLITFETAENQTFVEYRQKTASNPDTVSDTPIQQIFNTPSEKSTSKRSRKSNPAYSTDIQQNGSTNSTAPEFDCEILMQGLWIDATYDKPLNKSKFSPVTRSLEEAHQVHIPDGPYARRVVHVTDSELRLKVGNHVELDITLNSELVTVQGRVIQPTHYVPGTVVVEYTHSDRSVQVQVPIAKARRIEPCP